MQTMAGSNLVLWSLLCLVSLAAGVLLLVLGLKRRYRGDEPHCAKCNYNLTGVASEVCPECGTARTPETIVHGERYRRPWLAILGVLLLLASCAPAIFLFANQPPSRRPVNASNIVRNVKIVIAHTKTTYQTGRLWRDCGHNGACQCRVHPPMSILTSQVDRIRFFIQRCAASQTVKTNALAQQQATDQYLMSTVMPAYEAAVLSKKPEDAQALVPLMDQLDKHMDNLLKILNGY